MKIPIKYKPYIIATGILLAPLAEFITNKINEYTGTHIQPRYGDLTPFINGTLGLAIMYYWTSAFENIKPPRFKNFLKIQRVVWPAAVINRRKHPKRWLDLNLKLHEITYREEFQREGLLGNYHIAQGDLELGVHYYQRLLETDCKPEENILWKAINGISRPVVRLMFHSDHLEDLLEVAQYELQRKDYKQMKDTWRKIKRIYPSDRTEILEGIFLTSADLPETQEHWKGLIAKHKSELQSLGASRNKVTKIPTDEHKSVLVIKQGSGLRQEYDVLRKIYDKLPPEERISVLPLAVYNEKDEDCLVTLRKDSPDLDFIIGLTTGDESLAAAKKAITNLRRLHKLEIPELQPYNLIPELQRRLTKRFPAKDPRRFLDEYERFKQKFEKRSSPVHGDAYPTNVLKDGTLLDLEKASLGDPWLDLETFTTHPFLIGIQDQILAGVDLNPATRPLYAVHVALCQTGSFSTKSITRSRYFYELAKMRLEALGERALLDATKDYLGRTIDVW
ncbi:hypothetical protein J4467_00875 [Candidatus Woesearchaeota archaeon]|nr:hypothetical protein [Candidatus Woesearchaeota archaeon]